jgi:hypothetical protein
MIQSRAKSKHSQVSMTRESASSNSASQSSLSTRWMHFGLSLPRVSHIYSYFNIVHRIEIQRTYIDHVWSPAGGVYMVCWDKKGKG